MITIVEAAVVGMYTLRLVFDDGQVKTVNLRSRLWGPVFEPLLDPQYFATVTVDPVLGTIVWPNGADFGPEFLYEFGSTTEHVAISA